MAQPDPASVHDRGEDVGWWSVYEIGQRLCDKFDDVRRGGRGPAALPRVFIAGDACHTHSAQAGQGMNVSMADALNLGWKLAAVLRGTARPSCCTPTPASGRGAQELIDFDREFARMFSAPPKDLGHRGRGHRPGGLPPPLRPAGPLHRGRRDPVPPVDDHRRHRPPAPGDGFPGRRCASTPPRSSGWPTPSPLQLGHVARGRRRLAALRLRRPPRPASPDSGRGAVRFLASDESPSPASRRPAPIRLRDRRPRGVPAGHRDLRVRLVAAVLLPAEGHASA